jgi:hypothetical protein
MLTPPFEGGCQCRSVRYRVDAPVHRANFCHCRMCQRQTGAPVVVWVTVPQTALQQLGTQPAFWRSSANAERGFCPRCGTPLFWRSSGPQRPGEAPMIDITAGSLDDPTGVAPSEHIWCESAMPWVKLADGLPRHPRAP